MLAVACDSRFQCGIMRRRVRHSSFFNTAIACLAYILIGGVFLSGSHIAAGPVNGASTPASGEALPERKLASGEETIVLLGSGATLRLRLELPSGASKSGLHYLRVEPADRALKRPVRESDVALRFASRTIDRDLDGDYNREALLLRGGSAQFQFVQLVQLHAESAALRLRVRLEAIEPLALLPARRPEQTRAASSTVYRFEHAGGDPLRRLAFLSSTPVRFVLHVPDGRRIEWRLPASPQNTSARRLAGPQTHGVAGEFPTGSYYLELYRVAPASTTARVWLRAADGPVDSNSVSTGQGGADVPRPLRSIAHVPIAKATALVPGKPLRERLHAARPRLLHTVRVQPGRPLRVDVRGAAGDLALLVRGAFRYRADFDPQGKAAHEFVVLPFAGEYQLLVEAGLDNTEVEIDYTITASPLVAHPLVARAVDGSSERTVRRGVSESGLYLLERPEKAPAAAVDVRAASSADLFLTLYRQYADGSLRVEDLDGDVAGETGHENAALDNAVRTFILVRHSSAQSSRFAYRIRLKHPDGNVITGVCCILWPNS